MADLEAQIYVLKKNANINACNICSYISGMEKSIVRPATEGEDICASPPHTPVCCKLASLTFSFALFEN